VLHDVTHISHDDQLAIFSIEGTRLNRHFKSQDLSALGRRLRLPFELVFEESFALCRLGEHFDCVDLFSFYFL